MRELEEFEACARKLAAFTDVCRIRIVDALFRADELTVSAIAALVEQPLTTTSHHLSILLKAGIVKARKGGRFVYYALDSSVVRINDGKVCEKVNLGCCTVDFEPKAAPIQSVEPSTDSIRED